jgi:NADH-quinone oxidoreductase subunit L
MFLAVGAGAFVAAIFHLLTHAFFKALLFLGSGSVIEACHHEQDIRKMGGLGAKLPITKNTFIIGSLALAGVPIFAGFFSKDEILYSVFTSQLGGLGKVLWILGAAAALLTAFYITRLVALTFYGKPRDKHIYEHAHESPRVMTVPLVILAVLSTVGGFLGLPLAEKANVMHNWLGPWVGGHGTEEAAMGSHQGALAQGESVTHAAGHSAGLEVALMAISVALAIIGIWTAWRLYIKDLPRVQELSRKFAGAYRVLWNKYYVDEIYNAMFVRPIVDGSRLLWRAFDVGVIDWAVNGAGRVLRATASYLRPIQNGLAGSYAAAILLGAILIMGYVLLGGWR